MIDPADVARARASVLFAGVHDPSLDPLIEACATRELAPGDVLLAPGADNASLYVILSGRMDVHLVPAGPDPYVSLGPGNCVGEISLIDGQRPSASVVAALPTRVLVIPQPLLWEMVDESDALARNLLHVLSGRMRNENKSLVEAHRVRRVLEQAVSTDALTGVHNRAWMMQSFPRQRERCVRAGQPFSVVVIDLDGFKTYNDTQGHQGGDAALRTVARVLSATVRPGDLLARYGGEEFVAFLPGCGKEAAREAAERLRAAVAAVAIEDPDGNALPPATVSIGVAEASDGETLEAVFARADAALYEAKRSGRNCVRG
jgi:diguanylate cyclase (GGDEF)-like protein